jgi:hypothetical protein
MNAVQFGGGPPASAGFLFGIHFDPENGDDNFLGSFSVSSNCTALQSSTVT